MIFDRKLKRENVDITLSELIDKYAKTNYLSVDFKPNGTACIFIARKFTSEDEEREDREE